MEVKYYRDIANDWELVEHNYIVVYENSRELHDGHLESWLEGFNVFDGHFELKDESYLDKCCVEVSKEEYLLFTKSYYTPEVYL